MRVLSLGRRMLRIGLFLFLGLLALAGLLLGGGLLFLHSDAGSRWVESTLARTLETSLQGTGLSVRLGGLSGPLPQRLTLTDLRLCDRKGLWLHIPEIRLRLRLSALARAEIAVDELLIRDPALYRLPEMADQPQAPPERQAPFSFAGLGDTGKLVGRLLSFVRMDGLNLAGARIAPVILGLPAPSPAAANSADEPPDSASFPTLTLTGGGPLTDWSGALHAAWGRTLRLEGRVNLGNKGDWLRPAPEDTRDTKDTKDEGEAGHTGSPRPVPPDPDVAARLELAAWVEESGAAPRSGGPVGSPDARLTALVLLASAPEGALAVPALRVRLSGADAEAWATASDSALNGRLLARLSDPGALEAMLRRAKGSGLPVPAASLPLRGGDLALTLGGRPDAPDLSLASTLRGIAAAGSRLDARTHLRATAAGLLPGTARTEPAADAPLTLDAEGNVEVSGYAALTEPLKLNLALAAARRGGRLELSRLACRLNDGLFELTAQGRYNPAGGDAALTLRAAAPSLGKLPLAHWPATSETPSGSAALVLDLVSPDAAEPSVPGTADAAKQSPAIPALSGTARLSGADLRWGLPFLDQLLGAAPALDLAFAYAPETPSRPRAEARLERLALTTAHLTARGSAGLTFAPSSAPPASEDARINADLTVSLTSLAALAPLVPTLAGTLEGRLSAAGPLSAPSAELLLTSPRLSHAETVLTALQGRLTAARLPLAAAAGEAGGLLRLEATVLQPGLTSATGDPLRFATDWTFRPATPAAPGTATLQRIEGRAPGLDVTGALTARLPADADAPPAVTGGIRLAVTDWELVNAAAGLRGKAALRSRAASLNVDLAAADVQTVRADLDIRALTAGDVALSRARARLNANDIFGTPKLDFKASLGPGKAAGRSWKRGEASVAGPASALAVAFSLDGQVAAGLKLELDIPKQDCRITRLQARDSVTGVGLRLNAPLRVAYGVGGSGESGLRVQGLDLALLPSGTLRGNAVVAPDHLNVEATLAGLALGRFRDLAPFPLPDAEIAADVRLSRPRNGAFPAGKLTVRASGIRYPGNELPPVDFRLNGDIGRTGSAPRVRAEAVLGGIGPTDLTANLTLPLESRLSEAGLPQPAEHKPLEGSVRWQGAIAPLWNFVPLADRQVTGRGSLDATLSGTLAAPKLAADLKIAGAEYDDLLLGLMLTDINADISIRSAGESRIAVTLGDGRGGEASLDGTIGRFEEGLPLALQGEIRDLAPLRRNDLSITLSGDASVRGPAATPSKLAVKADITVDGGEFKLVRSFGSSIPTLDVTVVATPAMLAAPSAEAAEAAALAAQNAAGPTLDVAVILPGRFFVRGKGLESEWKGKLKITGAASNPAIEGQLSSVRGSLALLGKEFTLTRGNVLFTGATPPNPSLDVVLTYNGPTITAQASVTGSVSAPALHLSSNPPLPQDEVVAQVLFGQSAGSLSRLESLQLANELRLLAGFGEGGPGLLDTARTTLGMDVLRFGSIRGPQQTPAPSSGLLNPGQPVPGENGQNQGIPALEVGKYVMDNVYVGLEQGMNGDTGGVRVEIELRPNINLEASSTPEGSEVGINWKKDY